MLGIIIKFEIFEQMWRITIFEFREYLTDNIICEYIIFNNSSDYEKLKKLIYYICVYVIRY